MTHRKIIRQLYEELLSAYGPQGWWPVPVTAGRQRSACDENGYHPGVFNIPATRSQQLEIALGAVLTQNTSWKNAAAALLSLSKNGLFSQRCLLEAKNEEIALAIRTAGYYNQKSKTIKSLVFFLQDHPFKTLEHETCSKARRLLLQVRGIGPETADCILLYALKKPIFVVDAYTRRILAGAGVLSEKAGYNELQALFESSLEKNIRVYQEYHALLVQHGKLYYSRKPHGKGDVIIRSRLVI